MPTTANKKIFISDIHLGDERSWEGTPPDPPVWFQKYIPFLEKFPNKQRQSPPYSYVWIRDNIKILAKFLDEQVKSDRVEQVVILGDLFDRWIIPTDEEPLTDFQAIYKNPHNEPVITALKKLAENHKLTYVPGNHDMAFSTAELAEIMHFIDTKFKGINYLPEGVYPSDKSGTIVGEHGNYYTLFNAPDPWVRKDWFLPLGYFISRVQAYNLAKFGKQDDFFAILRNLILENLRDEDRFIKNVYEAWATHAHLEKTAHIEMKGIDGYPATVEKIGDLYVPLIKKWQDERDDIKWLTALAGDCQHLLLAAAVVYFSDRRPRPHIVIFGHTHKAEMWKNYELPFQGLNNIQGRLIQQLEKFWDKLFVALRIPKLEIPDILKDFPMVKHFHLDLPCRSIYVNSGTWVDDKHHPCTYVETQEDFEVGRHYVRLKTYPANKVLKEEYVSLK